MSGSGGGILRLASENSAALKEKSLRFFAGSAAKKWPPLEAAEVIICAAAPAPGKASDLNLGELCVLLCGPGFCGCR